MGVVMPRPRERRRGAARGQRGHLPGPVASGVAPLPALRHLRAPIVSTRLSQPAASAVSVTLRPSAKLPVRATAM